MNSRCILLKYNNIINLYNKISTNVILIPSKEVLKDIKEGGNNHPHSNSLS